jgi:hypothetical protein
MQTFTKTNFTGNFNSNVENLNPIAPKKGTIVSISILEEIGHQILKSKHMFICWVNFSISFLIYNNILLPCFLSIEKMSLE